MEKPQYPGDTDYTALFNAAPSACLVLNPQLHIVGVSDRYLEATMTRREQVLGRGLFDVFPDDPNDPQADGVRNLRASLDRVRKRKALDVMAVQRYPIRRPDGSFEVRYWAPQNQPVLDAAGNLRWIIHHVDDVTRRENAEAALRLLSLGPESTLPSFFDGMFEGVQVVDFEGRYLYLNETAAAQGRSTREALLGRRMAEVYPGIEQTEMYSRLRECLEHRQPGQMSNQFAYPDGGSAWFELRMEPVPVGALILSADVSQRKKLEEALRSSERLEAVGRLAGGIAHDFNNLLTIITGYASLIRRALPASDANHGSLDQIQIAGNRAAELTRQLLAYSRKQVLKPRDLDLGDSLRSTVGLLERVISKSIQIQLAVQPGLEAVRFDPGQLEQIILNLALNARDAMPDGGALSFGASNVDLPEGHPALGNEAKPGRYVLLSVMDTGTGMDAATRERIFEPFFTTKPVGQGNGLGLATVHGIVRQSGGAIWVYSEPGHGTCFKIYLPCAAGAWSKPEAAAVPTAGKVRGCVLLVEDEDGLRQLFHGELQSAGLRVLVAANAAEALETLRQHDGRIDLLLTDLVLPGGGGHDLAAAALKLRRDLKVAFMSGYPADTLPEAERDISLRFISKPVQPTELLRQVQSYLTEP